MALDKSKKEIRAMLADEVKLKMELEVGFANAVRKFFVKIKEDFQSVYENTGLVINPIERQPALKKVLFTQMMKVSKRFDSQMRRDLRKSKDYREYKQELLNAEVALANETDMSIASEDQSMIILATIGRELTKLVADTIALAAVNNEEITQGQIAQRTADGSETRTAGRPAMIAQTETQFAAERSKFNEAKAVQTSNISLGGVLLANLTLRKEWATVLDERTRISHVRADGQVRNLLDPFRVQGQSLGHPRDTSMGATADNVINCRCSVVFVIGKEPTLL